MNIRSLKNNNLHYCEISKKDFDEWLAMGLALWPHYIKRKKKLEQVFRKIIKSTKETAFLCKDGKDQLKGFMNISLRNDYVQGGTTSPICYIEGIYVRPEYRKHGVAKKLIKIAEQWALKKGCTELASDAELSNIKSQKFHKKLGFREVNRTANFIRNI